MECAQQLFDIINACDGQDIELGHQSRALLPAVLSHCEKLQQDINCRPMSSTALHERSASDSSRLSRAEQSVLRTTSFVNGKMYVPFLSSDPQNEQFEFSQPFRDDDGKLTLSAKQVGARVD